MRNPALAGMRLLVMEDEVLIAMDVEQLCHDHGAAKVVLVHALDRAPDMSGPQEALETSFDAAILDVALGEDSTLPFAARLAAAGVPFIFATGHTGTKELLDAFPGVAVIGKPYGGQALIDALSSAIGNSNMPGSQGV